MLYVTPNDLPKGLFLKTHLSQQELQHLRSGQVPVPDNLSREKAAEHDCAFTKACVMDGMGIALGWLDGWPMEP